MATKKSISIACASAFWGDTPYAVEQLLREPKLDYIAFDYLSEVTMTLLARFKKRDPAAGFVPDFFTDVVDPHLKTCVDRGIKLLCNAGAMNPRALKNKIEEFAAKNNFKVKVVCVEGDDLLASGALASEVTDMDGQPWATQNFISANAYLGAPAVVEALNLGADLVLTGRTVDTALVVAPIVYEFGWSWDQYDQLAQASLAGHIVECGTQCTGGNFTDWESVPQPEDVGFPILHVESSGEFTLGKAPQSGGLVTIPSVAEQIVYEIGNPRAYVLPDVICDFSQVSLSEKNRGVHISGAKGLPPTASYKVSATVQQGWKISTTAFMAGGDAKLKAEKVGEIILKRCSRILKAKGLNPFSETRIEALGAGEEVLLRISATHAEQAALEVLAKEIAPAATSLAPGLTNLLGGRASPTPRIRLVNLLVDKNKVGVSVFEDNQLKAVQIPSANGKIPSTPNLVGAATSKSARTIPLSQLAYARSGDKGNSVNIGIIARDEKAYEILRRELTPAAIAQFFASEFDNAAQAVVEAWDLPGIKALNFLIHDCLGGGGAFSLKVDPQGKAFAQRLLQMQVPLS